jgi:hypothetical protein
MDLFSNELREIEHGPGATFEQCFTFTRNPFRQFGRLDSTILTEIDRHSVEEDARAFEGMYPWIPVDDATEPAVGAFLPEI